jgi:hypothetical protein
MAVRNQKIACILVEEIKQTCCRLWSDLHHMHVQKSAAVHHVLASSMSLSNQYDHNPLYKQIIILRVS